MEPAIISDFIPEEDDIFVTISTGERQRLIFGAPLELTEKEEKLYTGFRSNIEGEGLIIPAEYVTEERHAYRFL